MTRVLLDTNVVLRTLEPGHLQYGTASNAVESLRVAGHELVVVPQVLYELWSVATRPVVINGLGMSSEEAGAELSSIKRLFRLLRDERSVYREWETLVAEYGVRGKQAHDARLVAAMLRHGITRLLTFNTRDFTRYDSIVVLSPAEIAGRIDPD